MRKLPAVDVVGTKSQRSSRYSIFRVQRRMALGVVALMLLFGFPFLKSAQAQLQGAAGNVRVNIEWNGNVDLDLYVTDPCGNRLGFGAASIADCNGLTGNWDYDDTGHGDATDNPNAENIVWSNRAPVGRYQVHVNYYSGSASTNYTIRIFLGDRGQPTSTHQGTIGPAERRRLRHVTDFEADESVNLPVISIRPDSGAIDEGASASFTLMAEPPPATSLQVSVTASQTGDFAASGETGSRTVTIGTNGRGTLSVATVDDATDEANGTITVTAADGEGYVVSQSGRSASLTVNDNDEEQTATAPGTPRNLRATPGDGEVTLTWSAPLDDGGAPIVRYEYQVDGGAWSNTAGSTRHVVDGLINGTQYTFGVRAINAVSAQDPDSESTSALAIAVPRAETVDSIEQEAITETVEAVTAATAANIAANIGTRFAAARSGGTVVVGGQPVNFGPVPGSTVMFADAGRDRDPFDEFSSAHHGRSLGVDELLRSSAFEVSLNATDDESQSGGMSPRWTIWGRGDFQFFKSLPERGATYDGSLQAGYLGVDARWSDQWLFGLAASLTKTEADYGLGDGSGEEGRLDASITGLHPYLRYSFDDTIEIWTILGLGQGEITNERAGRAMRVASDLDMRMAAAGARRNLLSDREWNLTLLGDVGIAQIETEDGVQAIQGLSVDTWRGRVGVEGSYTALLESGYAVTTFAEVAGRYDGGENADEVGLEISPGVYVAGPNGLGVEVRGRVLALHTGESYEEYGASMTLSMSPRPGGTGLALSISPRLGAGAGSADTLWREDPFALYSARSAEHDALSLDVGLGYGIRAKNVLLTPFGEFSMRDEGSRRSRAGARFSLTRSSLGELSLELLGERHEPEGADPEHGVVVTGRLRF